MAFARPWLLLVGAACAAAVLLLHMLRHRPGPRLPLPTARFLAPDRRTRLRLHIPSHPALLAARVGVVAALAMAAAGTTVPPSRDGDVRIVALDAGAGMGPVWEAALDSAEAALSGGAGARLVAFDTAPAPLTAGALDSLRGAGPAAARADYRAAFRALRAAASASDGEAFEAVLVTRPRAHAWGSGMAAARAASWPAPIRVIAVAAPGDAAGAPSDALGAPSEGVGDSASAPAGPRVRLHGRAAADPHLRAALASLGATGVDAGPGVAGARGGRGAAGAPSGEGDGGPPLLLGPGDAPAADAAAVLAAGGVVGSWGTAAPGRAGLWRAAAAADGRARRGSGAGPASASDETGSPAPATAVLLAPRTGPVREAPDPAAVEALDPVVVEAPLAVAPGAPDPDARVWAVAGDGRALGVAITAGEGGCASHFGGDLLDPRVVASPRFPDLVGALLDGCGAGRFAAARPGAGRSPADVGALGPGATRVLSGAAFPAASARSLGLTGGRSLVRPLLLLALALALVETALGAAAARRSVAVAAAPAPPRPGARAA